MPPYVPGAGCKTLLESRIERFNPVVDMMDLQVLKRKTPAEAEASAKSQQETQ